MKKLLLFGISVFALLTSCQLVEEIEPTVLIINPSTTEEMTGVLETTTEHTTEHTTEPFTSGLMVASDHFQSIYYDLGMTYEKISNHQDFSKTEDQETIIFSNGQISYRYTSSSHSLLTIEIIGRDVPREYSFCELLPGDLQSDVIKKFDHGTTKTVDSMTILYGDPHAADAGYGYIEQQEHLTTLFLVPAEQSPIAVIEFQEQQLKRIILYLPTL